MPQTSRLSHKAARPFFTGITQPLEEQQDNQRDGKRHDDCTSERAQAAVDHRAPLIAA